MAFLYLVCILVALGLLFWLKLFDVRNSTTQFVTLLIILVANLGFYFVAVATTVSEAVLGQKIGYVCGVFMPAFYFFMVLEICHINIKTYISAILLAIQCAIYGVVCTIGTNDLFYKNVSIDTVNGTTVLVREYGQLHGIYIVSMFLYLLASIVVAIYSVTKKKNINRGSVIAMIGFLILGVGVYVFEKAIHYTFELAPAAYVLLMIGALIPIYKSNLYTVEEQKSIIDEQMKQVGFITFDTKRNYQHSNEFVADIFPEILNYRVGQRIEGCSPELQKLINQINNVDAHINTQMYENHLHNDIEAFWVGDRCYEGKIHEVRNTFGVVKGYTIELRDDTADRLMIKLKENYNRELSRDVTEKTRRIRRIQQKTILGMAQMVESRDLSTGGHIKRTSDVVKIFSKKLRDADFGFDKHFLNNVVRSAPMHDLGKIGVDDAILRKQGKFTDEEYAMMKKHSEIGYHMLSEILEGVEEPDFVSVAENVAHYHHEKVDGTGYPHGLKGDEIPVEARIMALADVFDALVSKRCYKEAFSYDKAFGIIEHDAGTHFDAALAKVFIDCRPELEEYYNKSEE